MANIIETRRINLLMMLIKSQQHKSCWADSEKLGSSWNSISLAKKRKKEEDFSPFRANVFEVFPSLVSVFVRCEMMFHVVVCVCVYVWTWKESCVYERAQKFIDLLKCPKKAGNEAATSFTNCRSVTGKQIIESNESEKFNWLNRRDFLFGSWWSDDSWEKLSETNFIQLNELRLWMFKNPSMSGIVEKLLSNKKKSSCFSEKLTE